MSAPQPRWPSKRRLKSPREKRVIQLRLVVLRLLVVVMFGVLLGRLWTMQVVEGHTYQVRASDNSRRALTLPAPRGVIYDRAGTLLVRNVPTFTIAVVPTDLPEDRQ